jgi:hypothetical protein
VTDPREKIRQLKNRSAPAPRDLLRPQCVLTGNAYQQPRLKSARGFLSPINHRRKACHDDESLDAAQVIVHIAAIIVLTRAITAGAFVSKK